MKERCESCGSSQNVHWYVWDDNAEVTLCSQCVKDLRKIGERVVRIPGE